MNRSGMLVVSLRGKSRIEDSLRVFQIKCHYFRSIFASIF